jgi:hypothetical protein
LDLPQNSKRNIMQHCATSPKIWRQRSTLCDLYDCKCLILIYTSNGRPFQNLPPQKTYLHQHRKISVQKHAHCHLWTELQMTYQHSSFTGMGLRCSNQQCKDNVHSFCSYTAHTEGGVA